MPNNWKTYKIKELGEVVTGNTPSSKNPKDFGEMLPFVTPSDFKLYNKTIYTSNRYLSTEGINRLKSKILPENSIIVTCIGSDMGKVAINKKLCITNQQINSVKINLSEFDPDYIYYKLTSIYEYLKLIAGDGTTMPIINKSRFENIEFKLPPLQEQQSIASILSDIDDKIENNLAINKTLEEMAMALYKHWFVDFGPFQDGEFVESELGMIPKGWEVKRLDELADIGSSKRIFYDEYVAEGIPFYRGKEVIELSKGKSISSELFISEKKFNEIKERFDIPIKGDILISSVGTIGVSWLVDGFEEFYFKDGNLTWIKKYKTFLKGEYLHLWLNSENGKNQIDGEVIGSTQKALTISSLRNFKILFPNEEVYNQIGNEFTDYYEQRQLNLIEIKTLTQLRDTLLPQLISGAVRLKEFRE